MAAYRWDPEGSPREELRSIARKQVERALEDLDDDDRHVAVHQVRKRGKKVRALLRLVRPSAPELYERENVAFRDAMRSVSAARDAAVALETYDELVTGFVDAEESRALAPVRAALADRRAAVVDDDLEDDLAAIRSDLEAACQRIETWDLDGQGVEVIAGGLAKTYDRCRDRLETAYEDPTSEAFHEWRKRVKYHRYHVRILQDVWPKVMKAHRKELHRLSDLLGDDHDLAVLREDLLAAPDDYGGEEPVAAVTAFIDRRRAELQDEANTLGRRCFTEPTDRFVDRIEAYWSVTVTAPPSAGLLADATVPAGR